MKVLGLSLLALSFMYVPFIMLETLVMPELLNLQQTYSNAEAIAQTAAGR